MVGRVLIVVLLTWMLLTGCGQPKQVYLKSVADLVAALADPSNETRAEAAASLRQIMEAEPSARINDHGEVYWKERVDFVKPDMKYTEVKRLLRSKIPNLAERPDGVDQVNTSCHDTWRLDDYWTVIIHYRYPGTVLKPSILKRETKCIWIDPPADYTGIWVTWYVNGRKCEEIDYTQGQRDGAWASFYDNGQMSYLQHYEKGVWSGSFTGWFPDGTKRSEGFVADNKLQGLCAHWFANGQMWCQKEYKEGELHGISHTWDESGKLLWAERYENGKFVEQLQICEPPEQSD